MEQNAQKKWYIGRDQTWFGPRTESEILKEIEDGILSWGDHVWTPGKDIWIRICDLPEFRLHMPLSPSDDLIHEIQSTLKTNKPGAPVESRSTPRKSVWFLQFQGSEFGPLTQEEVQVILKSGKLSSGQLYAWKEGMGDWSPIQEIAELGGLSDRVKASDSGKKNNKRASPRVPLVATVKFSVAGDNRVGAQRFTGICRDLSANGMLILGSTLPGYPGSLFNLEVSPASESGIDPFTTEAQVVRLLPDSKGFSVRFRNLDSGVAAQIQKYLEKQDSNG